MKYSLTSRPIRDRLKLWHDAAAKERMVDGPFSIAFDGPAEVNLALHARTVSSKRDLARRIRQLSSTIPTNL